MKVNYITVSKEREQVDDDETLVHRVLVGATDEDRWKWEIEAGDTGVNAKTIVGFILEHYPERSWAVCEKAFLHAPPGDPNRSDAIGAISGLADIAHDILESELTEEEAYEAFLGVDAERDS